MPFRSLPLRAAVTVVVALLIGFLPHAPVSTAHPSGPVEPSESFLSAGPSLPTGPHLPAGPALPTDPALPAGPALPTAPTQPAQPAAPTRSFVPQPEHLRLVSITPRALGEDGTLTATVEITNTSNETWENVSIELRSPSARVTDRSVMYEWQQRSAAKERGTPVATTTAIERLQPGEKTTVTVRADAAKLKYSPQPYYWGPRRVALTLVGNDEPLETLRTFTVWRPKGSTDAIASSVLLPIALPEPSQLLGHPRDIASTLTSGYGAELRTAALAPGADWWLDPALIDPTPVQLNPPEPGDSGAEPSAAATPSLDEPQYGPSPEATEYAEALKKAAPQRTVIAMPYAQADAVAIRQGKAQDLLDAEQTLRHQAWDRSGVPVLGTALGVPGPTADADAMNAAGASADMVITPHTSVYNEDFGTITPSSIGVWDPEGSSTPVLAPEADLSAVFTEAATTADPVAQQQLLLADTAVIASQLVSGPRHVLIAPQLPAGMHGSSVVSMMEAINSAPWITPAKTADLVEAAHSNSWASTTTDESGGLYAVGEILPTTVQPSAPGDSGRFAVIDPAQDPTLLKADTVRDLDAAAGRIQTIDDALNDDAPQAAIRAQIVAAATISHRTEPDRARKQLQDAQERIDEILSGISVVPASGYNLVADSSGVPITIRNDLSTDVTVIPVINVEQRLVHIGETTPVTVPAEGQAEITVPVEAVARGTVDLRITLETTHGGHVHGPVSAPLTVNPAWENWTTFVMVAAMTVLVIVGIARARNTRSSTRAPGVRTPEDPAELARTGFSTPIVDDAQETAKNPDMAEKPDEIPQNERTISHVTEHDPGRQEPQ